MRRVIPIVLALVLVVSVRTSAQEMPTAQKWTNVEWYMVQNWQFTVAEADGQMTILFDTAMPVLKESFPGMRCFRHITGEWDVTCLFPMPEGPSWLEWEVPPEFVDYITGIFGLLGEETMGMGERFATAIVRQTHTIVLEPTGGM
jgi:hypothetical protein